MENFNLFKKEEDNSELIIRLKLRKSFAEVVKDTALKAKESGITKSPFIELLIKSAIGNFYQAMKKETILRKACEAKNISYDDILDEECQYIVHHYLGE